MPRPGIWDARSPIKDSRDAEQRILYQSPIIYPSYDLACPAISPPSISCQNVNPSNLYHHRHVKMTTSRLPELNNNIVTSWIPLTTPAPAPYPSSCNSAFRLETLSNSITNIVAYDPWYGQAIDTNYQSCLAAQQTQWWAQQLMPTTMFNLGPFACPTPYTTAATSVVATGTTYVGCCPRYVFISCFSKV